MKLVICRVNGASLTVEGESIAKIDKGLFCLLGIGENDTEADAAYLAKKCANMRIFSDENDRMNLSVKDVGGQILVEPNFTLYGNVSHGNRPDFFSAMAPDEANKLFERFVSLLEENGATVKKGIFGADMQTEVSMDGPVTIVAVSEELCGGKS